MTMTLELPEEVMEQLTSEAERMKLTPEKWALMKLQRAQDNADNDASAAISDEKWREITRDVIEENRELLERLAQ